MMVAHIVPPVFWLCGNSIITQVAIWVSFSLWGVALNMIVRPVKFQAASFDLPPEVMLCAFSAQSDMFRRRRNVM